MRTAEFANSRSTGEPATASSSMSAREVTRRRGSLIAVAPRTLSQDVVGIRGSGRRLIRASGRAPAAQRLLRAIPRRCLVHAVARRRIAFGRPHVRRRPRISTRTPVGDHQGVRRYTLSGRFTRALSTRGSDLISSGQVSGELHYPAQGGPALRARSRCGTPASPGPRSHPSHTPLPLIDRHLSGGRPLLARVRLTCSTDRVELSALRLQHLGLPFSISFASIGSSHPAELSFEARTRASVVRGRR
jgi:hypothetical protein